MANRLQERRLALGLTQPQVSARLKEIEARADVGMVSRYEKGVCLPTPAQLEGLEAVLQADRLALFDAEDLTFWVSSMTTERTRGLRRRANTRPRPRRPVMWAGSASATASAGSLRRVCRTICSRCVGTVHGKAGMMQP